MTDYPDGSGHQVDLVTRAEWAAIEATDKNFALLASGMPAGYGGLMVYNVPAGKTLYLTQASFMSYVPAAANAELNQICGLVIINNTTGAFMWRQGGNGGGAVVFGKPLTINAGEQVQFTVYNISNHVTDVALSVGGYER